MSIITQLLTSYKLVDVILIIFIVAFFLKEIIQLGEFFHSKIKKRYDIHAEDEAMENRILEKIEDLEDQVSVLYNESTEEFSKIATTLKVHQDTLDQLVQSDKDDIRADIVKQHHYFMAQGYIDDFSMDAIEKRYDHYKKAGGNSYISDLVHDLRHLPKR